MLNLIFLIIGVLLGFFYRTLRDFIKEFKSTIKEKPEIGVNPASYGTVRGYANQDSDIGLVNSKTPEELEWQHRQELSKNLAGE